MRESRYGIGDGLYSGFLGGITYRITDRWLDGENEWHYRVTCDVWLSESQIVQMPDADVVEVRHGRWIVTSKLHPLPWDTDPLDWDRYDKKTHSEWEDYYECSECHNGEYDMKPQWRYCPNCGAVMDGGQDDG